MIVSMKRILFSIGIFLSLAACANESDWYGSYIYEADLGENVAGDALVVEYQLDVSEGTCKLTIQGYQVFEAILCTAVINERDMDILFSSYENGSVNNQYDVQVYSSAQRLFSLSADSYLNTHWDGIFPGESKAASGRYFFKKTH